MIHPGSGKLHVYSGIKKRTWQPCQPKAFNSVIKSNPILPSNFCQLSYNIQTCWVLALQISFCLIPILKPSEQATSTVLSECKPLFSILNTCISMAKICQGN